jgi:hypothetical protein
MSTGIVSTPPRVFLAFLIAPLLAVAGCDKPVPASSALRHAAGVSQADPSDFNRQRHDPTRNRVWMLSPEGVFLQDRSTGKLVEVPLPSWQWVDALYGCPPDLAVGPNGEAVVSSNIVPVLWRIDPETLAVTVHELVLDADKEKDIGFTGLVYSAEHGAYFAASEAHGSLWQIDPLLRQGRKIERLNPAREACSVELPRGAV